MKMKAARILDRWEVIMPEALADWDVWPYWERNRFDSMQTYLERGDILFDVGAEQGAISAAYSHMVGAGNMVLFEPSPYFWPNIRGIWEANGLALPLACYAGLLGAQSTTPIALDYDPTVVDGWPACSVGEMVDTRPYRYIHNHLHTTQQTRLDDWIATTSILPDAITIDVEGAELRVLKGAVDVLRAVRPHVWVSIHPDLMERDYKDDPQEVHALMDALGYQATHLSTDHEQHWFFIHPGRRRRT